MSDQLSNDEYALWVARLKSEIQGARTQAVLAVSRELVRLYHRIGSEILERQGREGWGARVVDRLSTDLREAFPDMRGLSSTNLKYMKIFAELCPDIRIGQQAADQLPWFHIITLLTKVAEPADREWYAAQAVAHGWSRATLEAQIKGRLHLRQGAALTNFSRHLAAPHAQLASAALKDPYHFDFLGLGEEAHEHDIESALVRHITRFLLELGAGFAFVGRQHRIEVAGDEFFIDLLFYHTRLKCYVVVELKATAFKPEHAGQLNFYLAAVDAQLKASDDQSTIGLLLCRSKNTLVAEYALSGIAKPMGVAEYQLVRALPEPLDTKLPSIEQLEEELGALLAGGGQDE
jgi:predicted nuclease of restriction endonuclease-like (RecB) superfamily